MAGMILRLSISMLLLTALPGYAQPVAIANRSAAISHDRMRSVLQRMGYEVTEKSSDDSTAFAFPLNGRVVSLVNRIGSMELTACFAGGVTPLQANQWNREHFSTGARLGEEGCVALRSNVNFGGGVTDEMIEGFISNFCTDVTLFARYLTVAGPADRPPSPIGPMEWSQSGQNTKSAPTWRDEAGSVPGLVKINRNISLRYDPDRWQTAPGSEGQFALAHASGSAHALVIAERIAVPRGSVEDVALANAQSVDPKARIAFRSQRRIGGADVRFLKIEAEVNAVPMIYWGCFYGGEYGTVQVVGYTAKTLLPEYQKDFTDLLNGFLIAK
jgi:Putative bacterial sensory transduction regulator